MRFDQMRLHFDTKIMCSVRTCNVGGTLLHSSLLLIFYNLEIKHSIHKSNS